MALKIRLAIPTGRHPWATLLLRVALMTVEGENDDISGVGQTQAAQDLCVNIPAEKKLHHLQLGVGHYGVFNGSRFRQEIAPRIRDFFGAMEKTQAAAAE